MSTNISCRGMKSKKIHFGISFSEQKCASNSNSFPFQYFQSNSARLWLLAARVLPCHVQPGRYVISICYWHLILLENSVLTFPYLQYKYSRNPPNSSRANTFPTNNYVSNKLNEKPIQSENLLEITY